MLHFEEVARRLKDFFNDHFISFHFYLFRFGCLLLCEKLFPKQSTVEVPDSDRVDRVCGSYWPAVALRLRF